MSGSDSCADLEEIESRLYSQFYHSSIPEEEITEPPDKSLTDNISNTYYKPRYYNCGPKPVNTTTTLINIPAMSQVEPYNNQTVTTDHQPNIPNLPTDQTPTNPNLPTDQPTNNPNLPTDQPTNNPVCFSTYHIENNIQNFIHPPCNFRTNSYDLCSARNYTGPSAIPPYLSRAQRKKLSKKADREQAARIAKAANEDAELFRNLTPEERYRVSKYQKKQRYMERRRERKKAQKEQQMIEKYNNTQQPPSIIKPTEVVCLSDDNDDPESCMVVEPKIEVLTVSDDDDVKTARVNRITKFKDDEDVVIVETTCSNEPIDLDPETPLKPLTDAELMKPPSDFDTASISSSTSTIRLSDETKRVRTTPSKISPSNSFGTPESSNDFLDTTVELYQQKFNFSLHGNDFNSSKEPLKPTLLAHVYESESSCSASDISTPLKNIVFNEIDFESSPAKEMFMENNLDSFSAFITPKRGPSIPSILTPGVEQAEQLPLKAGGGDCRTASDSSSESEYGDVRKGDKQLPSLTPFDDEGTKEKVKKKKRVKSDDDEGKSKNLIDSEKKKRKKGRVEEEVETPVKKLKKLADGDEEATPVKKAKKKKKVIVEDIDDSVVSPTKKIQKKKVNKSDEWQEDALEKSNNEDDSPAKIKKKKLKDASELFETTPTTKTKKKKSDEGVVLDESTTKSKKKKSHGDVDEDENVKLKKKKAISDVDESNKQTTSDMDDMVETNKTKKKKDISNEDDNVVQTPKSKKKKGSGDDNNDDDNLMVTTNKPTSDIDDNVAVTTKTKKKKATTEEDIAPTPKSKKKKSIADDNNTDENLVTTTKSKKKSTSDVDDKVVEATSKTKKKPNNDIDDNVEDNIVATSKTKKKKVISDEEENIAATHKSKKKKNNSDVDEDENTASTPKIKKNKLPNDVEEVVIATPTSSTKASNKNSNWNVVEEIATAGTSKRIRRSSGDSDATVIIGYLEDSVDSIHSDSDVEIMEISPPEVIEVDSDSSEPFSLSALEKVDTELQIGLVTEQPQPEVAQQVRTSGRRSFADCWTEDMDKFYNTDWGLAHLNLEDIHKTQSDDPRKWKILERDRVHIRLHSGGPRCNRCRQFGHLGIHCPNKKGPPKCSLCGGRGHYEPRCPNKLCTQCGRTGSYSTTSCRHCKNYKNTICSRCKMVGHPSLNCPDAWRRYHLTTEEGPVIQLQKQLKGTHSRWCSGCGKRGHFEYKCQYYARAHMPSRPDIISYEDLYGFPAKPKPQMTQETLPVPRIEPSQLPTYIPLDVTSDPIVTNSCSTSAVPNLCGTSPFSRETRITQSTQNVVVNEPDEPPPINKPLIIPPLMSVTTTQTLPTDLPQISQQTHATSITPSITTKFDEYQNNTPQVNPTKDSLNPVDDFRIYQYTSHDPTILSYDIYQLNTQESLDLKSIAGEKFLNRNTRNLKIIVRMIPEDNSENIQLKVSGQRGQCNRMKQLLETYLSRTGYSTAFITKVLANMKHRLTNALQNKCKPASFLTNGRLKENVLKKRFEALNTLLFAQNFFDGGEKHMAYLEKTYADLRAGHALTKYMRRAIKESISFLFRRKRSVEQYEKWLHMLINKEKNDEVISNTIHMQTFKAQHLLNSPEGAGFLQSLDREVSVEISFSEGNRDARMGITCRPALFYNAMERIEHFLSGVVEKFPSEPLDIGRMLAAKLAKANVDFFITDCPNLYKEILEAEMVPEQRVGLHERFERLHSILFAKYMYLEGSRHLAALIRWRDKLRKSLLGDLLTKTSVREIKEAHDYIFCDVRKDIDYHLLLARMATLENAVVGEQIDKVEIRRLLGIYKELCERSQLSDKLQEVVYFEKFMDELYTDDMWPQAQRFLHNVKRYITASGHEVP